MKTKPATTTPHSTYPAGFDQSLTPLPSLKIPPNDTFKLAIGLGQIFINDDVFPLVLQMEFLFGIFKPQIQIGLRFGTPAP